MVILRDFKFQLALSQKYHWTENSNGGKTPKYKMHSENIEAQRAGRNIDQAGSRVKIH